jgi:DNA polymerase-3 subunit delta'
MSFTDILGHDRQVAVVRRAVTTGQIPPAYLFHGEEGIGKLMLAREFAKALNCEGGAGPGESCGTCRPCRNIDAGCHPNVSTLTLEVNPDTGKLRQQIRIEQVRAAQEFLSLKAVGEGRKALIVDDAHLMNDNAMNALLKTLEEPPDRSHVILVTSRPNFLLPTILSRCRTMSFQPLKAGLVAGLLVDRKGMSEGDAYFAARMTGGRVGAALEVEPDALRERRSHALDMLSSLSDAGPDKVVKLAEEFAKDKAGLEDVVFFGTLWFRDLLVILVGGDAALAYNTDIMDKVDAWAARMTAYRAESALTLLKETGRALERTFNRRFLAEDLFFRLKEEALDNPALHNRCTI